MPGATAYTLTRVGAASSNVYSGPDLNYTDTGLVLDIVLVDSGAGSVDTRVYFPDPLTILYAYGGDDDEEDSSWSYCYSPMSCSYAQIGGNSGAASVTISNSTP